MPYFPASSSEEARKHVSGVVRRGSGLALIIGGVGAGKTLLLELLRNDLRDCGNIGYLNAGRIRHIEEFVQLGCFELGIKLDSQTSSLQSLRLQLRSLCEKSPHEKSSRKKLSKPMILLIDEADSLALECLDELRTWSDMGLRCVLAGTNLLEETLTHPKLAAFNQRIAARCYLEPFLSSETKGFLRRDFAAEQLDDAAAALVHRLTEGVPRLLRQLLENFAAHRDAISSGAIDCEEIQAVWNEIHAMRSLSEWRNASSSLENDEQTFDSSCVENWGSLDDDLTSDLAGAACLEVGAELAPRENIFAEKKLSENVSPQRTQNGATFEIIDYGYEFVASQQSAAQQEQEATPVTPAYVYQTNEPIVPQYPCYIDKNIAMMNWVAPGHRISSGYATSYTPASSDESHENVASEKSSSSESTHSVAPVTAAAPLTDSTSHMKTSLQEKFEETIPVVQNVVQNTAQSVAQKLVREVPESKVVVVSEKIAAEKITTAEKTASSPTSTSSSAPREKLRVVEWNEIAFPASEKRAAEILPENSSLNSSLESGSAIDRLVCVTHTLEQIVERLHGSHGVMERSLEKAVSSLGRRVEEIIDESLAPPIHELLEMFVDFEQQLQNDLQPFLTQQPHENEDSELPFNESRFVENNRQYAATKYDENLAKPALEPRAQRGVPVVRLFQDPPRRNFEVDLSIDAIFAPPRR